MRDFVLRNFVRVLFSLLHAYFMQNKNNKLFVLKSVKRRGFRLPSDESLISNVMTTYRFEFYFYSIGAVENKDLLSVIYNHLLCKKVNTL